MSAKNGLVLNSEYVKSRATRRTREYFASEFVSYQDVISCLSQEGIQTPEEVPIIQEDFEEFQLSQNTYVTQVSAYNFNSFIKAFLLGKTTTNDLYKWYYLFRSLKDGHYMFDITSGMIATKWDTVYMKRMNEASPYFNQTIDALIKGIEVALHPRNNVYNFYTPEQCDLLRYIYGYPSLKVENRAQVKTSKGNKIRLTPGHIEVWINSINWASVLFPEGPGRNENMDQNAIRIWEFLGKAIVFLRGSVKYSLRKPQTQDVKDIAEVRTTIFPIFDGKVKQNDVLYIGNHLSEHINTGILSMIADALKFLREN